MSYERRLSTLLSEFASTLLTDFPIQAILDHLVESIVEALPVTAVGITLIGPGTAPYHVAASDSFALTFERLQTESGEGPCRLAYDSGSAVTSSDLSIDRRFPHFSMAAVKGGLAAAFAFPLRHGDVRLGALDLYRDTPGALGDEGMAAAQTLADVAAAYILNAQSREEARATSERFRDSALHDALTGLPNRALLHQRLQHAAKRAERSHTYAAVLFADLDRFKAVNDTYGHHVGDDLLVAVAHRLSTLLRPGDTLARVSGDEFVFLCEDMVDASDIVVLAERINEALRIPFLVSGLNLAVTASVGMAYAGPGEAISNQMVVNADIAMYQAKRKGGATHEIIDLRPVQQSISRRSLEEDLQAAFTTDALDLDYQPIVRCSDGVMTGVEAMLRWTHPLRGAIRTADMVALAEDNGMAGDVGAWVLERGCAARGRWLRGNPDTPMDLAVNVSARQLMGPHFTTTVAQALERTAMDPTALILEMTESVLINDPERALVVLGEIKGLGVQLALDDFGTGYSSLSCLRRFPVDRLKIDRSLVTAIDRDATGAAFVAAIVNLAHVLGVEVIAEGVETVNQDRGVVGAGCDLAQGCFHFHPMPADAVAAVLGGAQGRLPSAPPLLGRTPVAAAT